MVVLRSYSADIQVQVFCAICVDCNYCKEDTLARLLTNTSTTKGSSSLAAILRGQSYADYIRKAKPMPQLVLQMEGTEAIPIPYRANVNVSSGLLVVTFELPDAVADAHHGSEQIKGQIGKFVEDDVKDWVDRIMARFCSPIGFDTVAQQWQDPTCKDELLRIEMSVDNFECDDNGDDDDDDDDDNGDHGDHDHDDDNDDNGDDDDDNDDMHE
jgi:hypothetical protein